mmetsp:Transcript_12957/g.11473  ORF Transcript_12957/g.11473 Transcript_12957/m.11473 type:complete len:171 (+) Transcript_12957:106-618(+)
MYLDNFNKAYYGSILVQHNHNNPVLITFYELMFLVTRPVYSDKKIEEEDKKRIIRRKTIRNRFYLWAFLLKNPELTKYRRYPKIENEDSEDEVELVESNEKVVDLEEAKGISGGGNEIEELSFNPSKSMVSNASEASVDHKESISTEGYYNGKINYSTTNNGSMLEKDNK